MREDVLRVYPTLDPSQVHVVRNGIDTDVWYPAGPVSTGSVLAELGVDPSRPMRGIRRADHPAEGRRPSAGGRAPLQPRRAIGAVRGRSRHPGNRRRNTRRGSRAGPQSAPGVFWIREMLPIGKIREILSAATVFVCPSVYEPLGIVNLEAMACATAVVASDVGGIPEVVVDGVTGRWCITTLTTQADIKPGWPKRSMHWSPTQRKRERYGQRRTPALHRGFLLGARRRADAGDLPEGVCVRRRQIVAADLAGDALEFVAQCSGFVGC